MKASTRSRDELRFVTSVEQIVPFLNDLNTCSDENEIQQYSMEMNVENQLNLPVVLPPSTSMRNIYEEYVNFIDLSVLNPIVDAATCQRDQLIESEISEQQRNKIRKKPAKKRTFLKLNVFTLCFSHCWTRSNECQSSFVFPLPFRVFFMYVCVCLCVFAADYTKCKFIEMETVLSFSLSRVSPSTTEENENVR